MSATTTKKTYLIDWDNNNDENEQWYGAYLYVPREDGPDYVFTQSSWSDESGYTLTVGAAIAAGIAVDDILDYRDEDDIIVDPTDLRPDVYDKLLDAEKSAENAYYDAEVANRVESVMEIVDGKDIGQYAVYSPRRFVNELEGYAILTDDREAFAAWWDDLDPAKCWCETGDREWFERQIRGGMENLVCAERNNRDICCDPPEGVNDLEIWSAS
jgi:hypothetical protein